MKIRIIAVILTALCVRAMAATNNVHVTKADCNKATTGWGTLQPGKAYSLCDSVSLAQGASSDALRLVDHHRITFTAPARCVPSNVMADGPLLGNGDLGVAIGGPPEALRFHIGKNDFWGISTQSPRAVGRIELHVPAVAGAPYESSCDMRRARWEGVFTKDGATLATRAWVDANRNLFFIELENRGSAPLAVDVRQYRGMGGMSAPTTAIAPASVDATENPLLAGCEQHGRRWFFRGEMADLKVEAAAPTANQIIAQSALSRGPSKAFNGGTAVELAAPAVSDRFVISCWIKVPNFDEANYIVSKGDWNKAYSLGLIGGKIRFAVNGRAVEMEDALPTNEWLQVAGVFEGGKRLAVYINGKPAVGIGVDLGTSVAVGGDQPAPAFVLDPDAGKPHARRLCATTRIVPDAGVSQANSILTLAPGAKAIVATAVLSDLDTPGKDPAIAAPEMIAALTPKPVAAMADAHQMWWESYWKKSFIEIPDKTIEQCWYTSWYTMASCSRVGKIAPGLWGNWIMVDKPMWHGDWHLNYNFQAPFYGLYSANHAEVTLPFYDGMNQAIPRGRRIAQERGWKGIHLPISFGPWAMCPEGEREDLGQRSTAIFSAMPFVWYWQTTRDEAWLKTTGYPYLREVAAFWEDYLKLEPGPGGKMRYVIRNDSIQECSGPDMNGLLSLGMVRTLFTNMIPMSEAMAVDADKRAKWRDILEKISDFPTQQHDGKTIFRYTEQGSGWDQGNTLGIHHIFPGGAIGLDSDPKLLEISRNMIEAMARWNDYNGSSSWYTACVRVGYDPKVVLAKLRDMYDHHALPNKLLDFGGGGIENVSSALAVTEMLMQSHEGVIRFFPCWPKELNARFGSLRAAGAFLVSAEMTGGVVSGVKIISEKGLNCTILNPWPGKSVSVVRSGKPGENLSGDRFTIKTATNETIGLVPQ